MTGHRVKLQATFFNYKLMSINFCYEAQTIFLPPTLRFLAAFVTVSEIKSLFAAPLKTRNVLCHSPAHAHSLSGHRTVCIFNKCCLIKILLNIHKCSALTFPANLCNSPWDLALMVKLIGGVKQPEIHPDRQLWIPVHTREKKNNNPKPLGTLCARTHTHTHLLHSNKIWRNAKVIPMHRNKGKQKQSKMRWGRNCHPLPNSWDSIKSFFVC